MQRDGLSWLFEGKGMVVGRQGSRRHRQVRSSVVSSRVIEKAGRAPVLDILSELCLG
jgi:hypothetical protein